MGDYALLSIIVLNVDQVRLRSWTGNRRCGRNRLNVKSISRTSLQWIGTLLVLFTPWLLLVLHLSSFWSVDPQYAYGWVVPFLAALILWEKWRAVPADPNRRGRLFPLMGAGMTAVLFGLAWFVIEAVPDWSVANWFFALAVVAYQFSLIAFQWGFRIARYFLFPVAFLLCAVPWPQRLELLLVQGLMKGVASATADLLAWPNVPALASGNIIWLPTGAVGIDEACSGIRSLQATLMASLFLGQLLRMKFWARLILICIGFVLALFFNLVRTVALVWIAHAQGFAAFERWHDPAGFSVLGLSVLFLWLFARLLCGSAAPDHAKESAPRAEPLPLPIILSFTSWILVFLVGTEIWYRRHETNLADIRRLSIVWPTDVGAILKGSIPDSARRILLCDDARCASWHDQNGLAWTVYSITWNSGRTSTQSARVHRPENCLQGSGAILQKELDPAVVDLGGTPLAFRSYLFDWNRTTLYVFYVLWEQGNRDVNRNILGQDWSGISRLQRVWSGQRNLGQQSLEIVLFGATSDGEARTALRKGIEKMVHFL